MITTANTKVKVVMTVSLSVLMFLTKKHSLKDLVTFEQQYPSAKNRRKNCCSEIKVAKKDDKFAHNLVTWLML